MTWNQDMSFVLLPFGPPLVFFNNTEVSKFYIPLVFNFTHKSLFCIDIPYFWKEVTGSGNEIDNTFYVL